MEPSLGLDLLGDLCTADVDGEPLSHGWMILGVTSTSMIIRWTGGI
jgi:hypothetical protein